MYTQEKSTTISFFRHNKRAKENFDIYRLEYPKTGQAADYRHRFLDANSRHYDYNLQGKFFWKHLQTEQANGQLTSGYAFSQKEDSEDNPLYRLDWLGGEWADGDMERLNLLPSAREELLRCMDMDNSYFSTARTSRHSLSLDYLYDRKLPKMGWLEIKSTRTFTVRMPACITSDLVRPITSHAMPGLQNLRLLFVGAP